MVEGIDLLESILGKDLFKKEVEVIKTDRSTEFSDVEGGTTSRKRTHKIDKF